MFHLFPDGIHFVERGLAEGLAFIGEPGFNRVESAGEFFIGRRQGCFRLDTELAREIDDTEQQVANFILDRYPFAMGHSLLEFSGFLADFGKHGRDIGPVKTDAGSLLLQLLGAHQGGQAGAGAVQVTLLLQALFLALDGVPLGQHFAGVGHCDLAKDMGVTADQLVAQPVGHAIQVEATGFGGDLGMQNRLQEQIAQFFAEQVGIARADGIDHLIGFLQDMGDQAFVGLLAIPGAAAGGAQAVNNGAQAGEGVGGIRGHAKPITAKAGLKTQNCVDSPGAMPTSCIPHRDVRVTLSFLPAMASAAVLNLNESNFQSEIAASDVPVIVDFWAEWCGPCRMLGPILDQLADEKAGSVKVAKVNVDENPGLATQFNVRSIPMLLFIKGGEVKDTVVGVQSKDALIKRLEALA